MTQTDAPPRPRRAGVDTSRRRWALRGLVVVALAVVIGWAGDVRVGSGSDAGGKLATARVMAEAWTCDPDVGWWAADVDPDAELHQLVNTEVRGDRYVQATSVVYQCLMMPLQRAAGPWGPLAVSIAGAVAAALAAARIAWRLDAGPEGEVLAFWMVGVCGPAFFYALDVWEHGPALGLLAWVVALVLAPPSPRRALAAGALAGLSFALRAETVLYFAAMVVAVLSVGGVRRDWLARPRAIVSGAGAAAVVVALATGLERVLLGASVRVERSGSLAGQAGGELEDRAATALVTTIGTTGSDRPAALLVSALLCAALLLHGWRVARAPEAAAEPVQAAMGAGLFVRLLDGPGFVPGVLPAAPLSAIGVFTGARSPRHLVLIRTALIGPVAVLVLQWSGNLHAQWGGRYLLPTGLLLTAAACTVVPRDRRLPTGLAVVVAVSVAIAALGAVWRVQRSNDFGAVIDRIQEVPPDSVIVSTYVHLGREAGGTYGDHRWLVAENEDEIRLAAEVLEHTRPAAITVVGAPGREPVELDITGYEPIRLEEVGFYGVTIQIQRFERVP